MTDLIKFTKSYKSKIGTISIPPNKLIVKVELVVEKNGDEEKKSLSRYHTVVGSTVEGISDGDKVLCTIDLRPSVPSKVQMMPNGKAPRQQPQKTIPNKNFDPPLFVETMPDIEKGEDYFVLKSAEDVIFSIKK